MRKFLNLSFWLLGALALAAAPLRADDDELPPGLEVMTRGPIHEAFANPVDFNPQTGAVIVNAPPEAIDELPPDQKPEGDSVWIPGYWSWDDERNDYLWVSGIWRAAPPGFTWMPGYFRDLGGRYQWVSGMWQRDQAEELDYLPAPPRSLEAGPSVPQPSESHFWVPGVWLYRDARYVWRAGFWAQHQPNWVWVCARYVPTPSGYVYVDGYWDYPVARRGLLFAPVRVQFSVYRPSYVYTPSVVISNDCFQEHLFVRPRCGHYYFGDYYATSYSDAGYYSWHDYHCRRIGYDPFFTYTRCSSRLTETAYYSQININFNLCRRDHHCRPPRTYRDQVVVLNRPTTINVNQVNQVVVRPLTQVVNINNTIINNNTVVNNITQNNVVQNNLVENNIQNNTTNIVNNRPNRPAPIRFQKVAPEQRDLQRQLSREIRKVQAERNLVETKNPVIPTIGGNAAVAGTRPAVKLRLPESPANAHVARTLQAEAAQFANTKVNPNPTVNPKNNRPVDTANNSRPNRRLELQEVIRKSRENRPAVATKPQENNVVRNITPARTNPVQPQNNRPQAANTMPANRVGPGTGAGAGVPPASNRPNVSGVLPGNQPTRPTNVEPRRGNKPRDVTNNPVNPLATTPMPTNVPNTFPNRPNNVARNPITAPDNPIKTAPPATVPPASNPVVPQRENKPRREEKPRVNIPNNQPATQPNPISIPNTRPATPRPTMTVPNARQFQPRQAQPAPQPRVVQPSSPPPRAIQPSSPPPQPVRPRIELPARPRPSQPAPVANPQPNGNNNNRAERKERRDKKDR